MTFKNWPSYRYFNLVYPLPKNSPPPPLPPQHWPKCLKYFVVLHNKIRRQSAWQKTCAIFWACLHCPSGIGFWPTPPTTTTSSQQQQKLKRSSPHGSAALLTSPDFSLFSQAVSVHFSLYGVTKRISISTNANLQIVSVFYRIISLFFRISFVWYEQILQCMG